MSKAIQIANLAMAARPQEAATGDVTGDGQLCEPGQFVEVYAGMQDPLLIGDAVYIGPNQSFPAWGADDVFRGKTEVTNCYEFETVFGESFDPAITMVAPAFSWGNPDEAVDVFSDGAQLISRSPAGVFTTHTNPSAHPIKGIAVRESFSQPPQPVWVIFTYNEDPAAPVIEMWESGEDNLDSWTQVGSALNEELLAVHCDDWSSELLTHASGEVRARATSNNDLPASAGATLTFSPPDAVRSSTLLSGQIWCVVFDDNSAYRLDFPAGTDTQLNTNLDPIANIAAPLGIFGEAFLVMDQDGIYDVSDPANPSMLYQIPGWREDLTGAWYGPLGDADEIVLFFPSSGQRVDKDSGFGISGFTLPDNNNFLGAGQKGLFWLTNASGDLVRDVPVVRHERFGGESAYFLRVK